MGRLYFAGIMQARRILIATLLLCFIVYILGPFVIIYVKSFSRMWGPTWLPENFGVHAYTLAWRMANIPRVISNSLIISALAVLISTGIAIPTAWALGRRRLRGKSLLLAMFLLPRLIPAISFALGIARIFYRLHLVNTFIGVALAHVSVAAPYSILILTIAFEGLDERLLEASRSCGANARQRFFYVILPLLLPGILTSIIFTFAASYNELPLTLMTYGSKTLTLPVQAYLSIGDGFLDVASAIAVFLSIPSLIILLILQKWLKPEKLVGGLKGV